MHYVLPRSTDIAIRLWWMSSTLTLCGRMIIASTNYQTGYSRMAFATLAACLGVILGRPVAQNLNGKGQKRADFVRFATAALSSQSAPANYDKMRLLGLHIECQYGERINIACIIRSLVCCCCYDLKFTLAEYFKPTLGDIFHVFFLRKKMKSPCRQARLNNKILNNKCMNVLTIL